MDPQDMSDEELKAAISGEQPEETPTNQEAPADPPPKEEPEAPAEETPEPEAEETPAEEPDATADAEEKPPSRREQLRVQHLLKKYGPPQETPAPKAPEAPSHRPNYAEMLDAPEEVIQQLDKTAEELEKTSYERGTSETLKQLRTVEWRTNLRIDNQAVEQKFPQLNKNSEEFHPVLADAMNRRYLAMVGFNAQTGLVENPDVSYADFVESEFELADEIANTKVAKTAENIAKQAAQTGLRPSGGAVKAMDLNKTPEAMTNEELQAVINSSLPRDQRGRFTKR